MLTQNVYLPALSQLPSPLQPLLHPQFAVALPRREVIVVARMRNFMLPVEVLEW